MNLTKKKYILGIFCYFRDASACLLEDGNIVAMAEEERFTRKKHTGEFPKNAIQFCLDTAGITLKEVDFIAYGFQPWPFIYHQAKLFLKNFPKSLNLFKQSASQIPFKKKILWLLTIRQRFRKEFGFCPKNIQCVDHHLAHAYSSFFMSPFDKAAIFITDGFGESSSTSFYNGNGDNISQLYSIDYPDSLGMYYGGITELLGFRPENDEYKVMGMCAYGKDKYKDSFEKILLQEKEDSYRIDTSYFDVMTHGMQRWVSSKMEGILGGKRKITDPYEEKHFNIACSAQRRLEKIVEKLGISLQKRTKSKNICVSGGVAQNILMNRVLLDSCGFTNIFVPPVASDSGVSLGAALYIYHKKFKGQRNGVLQTPSYGPQFSDEECKKSVQDNGFIFEECDDITDRLVGLIKEGKIVGFFDGRMEIGPRALGNRSILADPRNKDMKDILNSRIKKREFFRPFAAMVPFEDAKKYFDISVEAPFMTVPAPVKDPELIPSATHNDGTCRVQTVRREIFPNIYNLLRAFEKETGVPILINTSFNENEPIVCTPQEALSCFQRTKMDAIVFNNRFLILK